MASFQLSALPTYTGVSKSRLQSLYSDISRQKHSNPTTYNSNIAWWRSTLEDIVSHGWQLNVPDALVLHAEHSLQDCLRYEGVGKPLCLGTVITELITSRSAIPLQQFMNASQSIYDPGWLPYRIAAFVIGKPLWWSLQQLNLVGTDDESDSERWKRVKGDYVLVGIVERAAEALLAVQRSRDLGLAERLYSFDSFRATFASAVLPGATLSDRDIRTLIRYLERDKRVVTTEKEVVKFVEPGADASEVTAVDRGILELKTAVINISVQIDSITAKIDDCKAKAAAALRQQHKSLALSYLRSRKQLEDVLTQRLGSLEVLRSTLLRVEGAAENIQIVRTYETSAATLRALLADPSLQRDKLERTLDALADANADAREVDEAVRAGGDTALGVGSATGDEDELKAELAALVAEAEAEAEAEARVKEQVKEREGAPTQHPTTGQRHPAQEARTHAPPDHAHGREPVLAE
ncbi:Snf7-domain-containing protein [Gloeopeniophorella convolvens]|nr:Snf7-domain-containing protein [Gloeopeniophorella convolvens]